jgi:hypothetical protein
MHIYNIESTYQPPKKRFQDSFILHKLSNHSSEGTAQKNTKTHIQKPIEKL